MFKIIRTTAIGLLASSLITPPVLAEVVHQEDGPPGYYSVGNWKGRCIRDGWLSGAENESCGAVLEGFVSISLRPHGKGPDRVVRQARLHAWPRKGQDERGAIGNSRPGGKAGKADPEAGHRNSKNDAAPKAKCFPLPKKIWRISLKKPTGWSLMPKRTDIQSILIIGAGPIIIGQACEFDYSGTQACKALREEGYRIILVNSNPATIMTDPDMVGENGATYVEPITPEIVAEDHRERTRQIPEKMAVLPTMGGQTALNTALALEANGTLAKYDVEMIGADCRSHRQGRGPDQIPRGDDQDRAGIGAVGHCPYAGRGAGGA